MSDLDRLMAAAALPSAAALVSLWGFHRLALWWRQATGREGEWRIRHTALAGSLVLLGSSSAIALSGVLHEAVWLPQGQVIQSNHSDPRFRARNSGRILGLYLSEYQNDHGGFPASLEELGEYADGHDWGQPADSFVSLGKSSPREPFVLTVTGRTGAGSDDIVLIGPQLPDKGYFVVVRADTSVSML
ncbi:MAG: hypothetical protein EOP87_11635, partial [Verrucomicrobiaceae bacterium]